MDELELADIRIKFEDDRPDVKLKPPTAEIAFEVNRAVGGFRSLLDRINKADYDAYFHVIWNAAEGVELDETELRDFIFKNPGECHIAVMNYAFALLNGGKSLEMATREAEQQDAQEGGEPESEEDAKKDSAKSARRRKAS